MEKTSQLPGTIGPRVRRREGTLGLRGSSLLLEWPGLLVVHSAWMRETMSAGDTGRVARVSPQGMNDDK
jgi:hypothetical protein